MLCEQEAWVHYASILNAGVAAAHAWTLVKPRSSVQDDERQAEVCEMVGQPAAMVQWQTCLPQCLGHGCFDRGRWQGASESGGLPFEDHQGRGMQWGLEQCGSVDPPAEAHQRTEAYLSQKGGQAESDDRCETGAV